MLTALRALLVFTSVEDRDTRVPSDTRTRKPQHGAGRRAGQRENGIPVL